MLISQGKRAWLSSTTCDNRVASVICQLTGKPRLAVLLVLLRWANLHQLQDFCFTYKVKLMGFMSLCYVVFLDVI